MKQLTRIRHRSVRRTPATPRSDRSERLSAFAQDLQTIIDRYESPWTPRS